LSKAASIAGAMFSDEILARLSTAIDGLRRSHTVRVAIDGIDGAGKTTLADDLVAPLRARGRPVIRASIDSFLRPRADRYRRGTESPEGYYLDSHDLGAVREALLVPLGPGGDGRYRTTIWDEHRDVPVGGPVMVADTRSVLLFDGIFSQRPELDSFWEFRIFVDLDFVEAERRAVERAKAAGVAVEAAVDRYRKRYLPGQEIYLASVHPRERADVVVGGSSSRDVVDEPDRPLGPGPQK
jgi:uridine kinase